MRPKKYKNLIKREVRCMHGRRTGISEPRHEFLNDFYFEVRFAGCGCMYEFERCKYIYIPREMERDCESDCEINIPREMESD